MFLFFTQKPEYEMRIGDWSSDVCSSDLNVIGEPTTRAHHVEADHRLAVEQCQLAALCMRVLHGRNIGEPRASAVRQEIGRAWCRERVCKYVEISVAAVQLKKNKLNTTHLTHTIHKKKSVRKKQEI